MTEAADRIRLLQLARDAIVAHVMRLPLAPPELTGIYTRRGAAFVSLHANGALRGCIGHLEADEPLGEVIRRCAVGACSHDPRFVPVTPQELPALHIELSLLAALEPIHDRSAIEIGRHGLVIEHGWHRGLLLPQVATEWNWDVEAFIAHTCQKAGLPHDAWQSGAKMWRFEAEVFGEDREDTQKRPR